MAEQHAARVRGSRARSAAPPAATDAVLGLEQLVSFRLGLIAKMLDRRLASLVSTFGLAVAEYRVLAQIAMRPGSTVGDISVRARVDKAQVSRSVASLETRKLVKRAASGNDRRSPVLTATRAGRLLIEKIAPLRHAQDDEMLAGMSATAVQQLQRNLTRLFDRLSDSADAH